MARARRSTLLQTAMHGVRRLTRSSSSLYRMHCGIRIPSVQSSGQLRRIVMGKLRDWQLQVRSPTKI
ncbi:hypothetical protein I7I53_11588 [Histoplasma capsulatum var. duboisii H88]|uniref:Uncharacterized protein n=1 Tax=Ajellomyces capsulatus (strain H88) TaxID=544711 RepID=A0A8A1LW06_AJEC8|nr:hypothetical protein I7I53_11588 [Histoplasma capsulatum var. duboisii H88]